MKPLNWENALLRSNPFASITPNPRQPNIVWAGMSSLKEQFNKLFFVAQSTPDTQIVLNWGAYGSGKSHASIYFTSLRRLPQIDGPQVNDVIFVRIQTPKDPAKPDFLLYRDILEGIRFDKLRQIVSQSIVKHGLEYVTNALQELTESEVLGKAITLLGLEPNLDGKLEPLGENKPSSDWQTSLEAYFYSQQTKSDLKKLNLSRGVDTAQERFRILSAIIQCISGIGDISDINQHARVVLWIDEMEDLIYFATKQYRPFTQGLRELIDRLPNYFTLLMNFTLASPEAFEDTTVVLGEALMERITTNIYFQEPNEQDAYIYVEELLRFYRTEQAPTLDLPSVYPFSPDALQRLISMLPRRTPREINKRCSEVISQALMQNVISGPGIGLITKEYIATLEDEQMNMDL